MKQTVDRRLGALEQAMRPRPRLRVMNLIINPDRSLHSIVAHGHEFHRLPGESDDAFKARVDAELGWSDE